MIRFAGPASYAKQSFLRDAASADQGSSRPLGRSQQSYAERRDSRRRRPFAAVFLKCAKVRLLKERGKTVTFWTASTLEVFEHPSSLGKSDVDQDAGSGSARHSFSNLGPARIQKLCYQIRLLHSPCQGNGDLELANLLRERARDDSIAFNRQIPGRGGKPTRVKPNPFPT